MSTIEKAVDKLEQKKELPEKSESFSPSVADTLERAIATQAAAPEEQIQAPTEKFHVEINPPQEVMEETCSREILELSFTDMAENGLLTPLTPRSPLAEEFRNIKRPLLRNIDGSTVDRVSNTNLIMVTSALQGDGKTFSALNLAVSIAMEQDKTVLFVDADVAKASAGTMLGISSDHPGLIDVLENKGVALADVILPTTIDNLRVLPAGIVHERSTELLASRAMHDLMLELSNRYADRVIVFDSPPLLLTTEASVLASFMGQIAFVVSTDETPKAAIVEALEHIGDDKIIGMILNKAHARRNKILGLSYGSRYGYGYGYGYGHEGRSAVKDAAS